MGKWQKPTIAFVPREFLDVTVEAFENLIAHTPEEYDLIVVAAGYPQSLIETLKEKTDHLSGQLLIFDHFLTPNQARNAALKCAKTDYIIFLDHDVFVEKNWLPPLLQCAQETGAAIVSPMIFEGSKRCARIHMAGGLAHVEESADGTRRYIDEHHHAHTDIDTLDVPPVRSQTELVEFHCVLVECSWLKSSGGLDEKLLSISEHWDMSVQARLQGRSIYLEPSSQATYTPPKAVTFNDLRWFNLRWSNEWNDASMEHLVNKYQLTQTSDLFQGLRYFLKQHQELRFIPFQSQLKKRYGASIGKLIFKLFARPLLRVRERRALKNDFNAWKEALKKEALNE